MALGVTAPDWLYEMIRPAAPSGYAARPPSAAPAGPIVGGVDRGAGYARAAVGAELAELRAALPGTRNETAFRVACRLAELVNAPWSRLDGAAVATAYMEACEAADGGSGTFDAAEAQSVLNKGIAHVGENAAVLPPSDSLGTGIAVPPGLADFSPAWQDQAPAVASPTPVAASLPGVSGFTAEQIAADPLAPYVEMAAQRIVIQERAKALIAARREVAERTDFMARMLTSKELIARPKLESLIDGWVDAGTSARIFGSSNHGKSFVSLDMSCCASLGLAWHGRATRAVRVVYVLAEAVDGMGRRVAAWEERHQRESAVLFLPEAVQIGGPAWRWFVADMEAYGPGLVVFDTQAESTVGMKENDNTEVGMMLAKLRELRTATGAATILVHHKGAVGGEARGASAGKGSMDSEIDVTRIDSMIRVRSNKQRDRATPDAIELTLSPLLESAVLVADGETLRDTPFRAPVTGSGGRQAAQFASRVLALVDVLIDNYAEGNGGTEADIKALYYGHGAVVELDATAKRKAFRRAWNRLEELGRLARIRGMNRYKFITIDDLGPLEANPGKTAPDGWMLAEPPTRRSSGAGS